MLKQFVALALGFVCVACGIDDSPTANLRIVQSTYDGPDLSVFLDGAGLTKKAVAYGTSSGYVSVIAEQESEFKFTNGADNDDQVIVTDQFLGGGSSYTIFTLGPLSKVSALLATDFRTPRKDKVRIRFVHVSPDTPAIDVKSDTGAGAAIFANIVFKKVSDYATVDPGLYNFVITPAGQSNQVAAFNPVFLEAGKVYSAVALGTFKSDDKYPLTIRLFVDNEIKADGKNADGVASVDLIARGG